MNRRSLARKGFFLCACLIALTTLPGAAAPVPDAAHRSRETFEALKTKLPQVVADVVKSDSWLLRNEAKVKLARRISADEAKVVMVSIWIDGQGKHWADEDEYLVFYLRYFDGAWTITRFEGNCATKECIKSAQALMLAIDQIGEK